MATIYSLNLSDPKIGPLSHAPFHFTDKTIEITNLEDVPSGGVAIVYLLAHAVPNAFRSGPSESILSEDKVAAILKARRGDAPTLLIIDACFAESFRDLAGGDHWPTNFGLIFSCQTFERTWHSDETSLFSVALDEVMSDSMASESFVDVQSELRKRFGNVQTPVVIARPELLHEIVCSPIAA